MLVNGCGCAQPMSARLWEEKQATGRLGDCKKLVEKEGRDKWLWLPETPSGLGGGPDGTVSVSMRGCVFRSGFSPDGRDTHIQARVRRPPTPDTRRVPGPDTRSVVRRQVRQETDQCLLATCQSLSLTVMSHSNPLLPLASFPSSWSEYVKLILCVSDEHTITSIQIHLLRHVLLAINYSVKWQTSDLLRVFYNPKVDDKKLLCQIMSFCIVYHNITQQSSFLQTKPRCKDSASGWYCQDLVIYSPPDPASQQYLQLWTDKPSF